MSTLELPSSKDPEWLYTGLPKTVHACVQLAEFYIETQFSSHSEMHLMTTN